eukprot:gene10534-583_t
MDGRWAVTDASRRPVLVVQAGDDDVADPWLVGAWAEGHNGGFVRSKRIRVTRLSADDLALVDAEASRAEEHAALDDPLDLNGELERELLEAEREHDAQRRGKREKEGKKDRGRKEKKERREKKAKKERAKGGRSPGSAAGGDEDDGAYDDGGGGRGSDASAGSDAGGDAPLGSGAVDAHPSVKAGRVGGRQEGVRYHGKGFVKVDSSAKSTKVDDCKVRGILFDVALLVLVLHGADAAEMYVDNVQS